MDATAGQARYGTHSMVAPLRRVLMHRPGNTTIDADPALWHYAQALDADTVNHQYGKFEDIVRGSGAEILWLDEVHTGGLADAIFTYDPSLITDGGAVLLRMGKPLRADECDAHRDAYQRLDIPVLGRIEVPGTAEGGDCFWVNKRTLAVGRGFRTNQAGIEQLDALLSPLGVEVLVYDLPVGSGAEACLHLMSLVSMLDDDLALVYPRLLPTALYQLMVARGIELVEASDAEFESSNGLCLNVLALGPRHGVMLAGFDQTRRALEQSGCRIDTFAGDGLCIPCEGGPTCMTRPLLRG